MKRNSWWFFSLQYFCIIARAVWNVIMRFKITVYVIVLLCEMLFWYLRSQLMLLRHLIFAITAKVAPNIWAGDHWLLSKASSIRRNSNKWRNKLFSWNYLYQKFFISHSLCLRSKRNPGRQSHVISSNGHNKQVNVLVIIF